MIFLKKSQDRDLAFKGQVTAFLTLIFILMLSVVGVLIESASIQITKNRNRADTILALESTFAEYHPELLECYEIFARFGCTEAVMQNRLSYYGANHMEHTIQQKQYLTDYNGMPFYRQAVSYMKNWLGLEDMSEDSKYQFSSDREYELAEKEAGNSKELETMLAEGEAQLPAENNPLQSVDNLKKSNLLAVLLTNQEDLSNRNVTLETLPSNRVLQEGDFVEEQSVSLSDKMFFVAYAIEHFSTMTNLREEKALLYELEYLIGGYSTDQENLEAVCKKIMNIRTVANYTYLLTDSTRQAEAEAMALALCSLITLPEITAVVKQALLFAWAYGESIVDTRALLKGKKVPNVKTSESWQLQLSNLSTLGTANEVVSEKDSMRGFSYQDYIKGLLLAEAPETLSMRALDLIESNLHIKTDQCMIRIEVRSKANLRRGIQDIFTTTFRYQ